MTTTLKRPAAAVESSKLKVPRSRASRVVLENSSIGELKVLHLVEQLLENANSLDQFQYWVEVIWPGAEVYHGHTHLRVMMPGNSIYVDKGGAA